MTEQNKALVLRFVHELIQESNIAVVDELIADDFVYHDAGAEAYDLQQRTRLLRRLRQRAATLGFELVNRETGEVVPAGAS